MINLAETTSLLDETTQKLASESEKLTAQEGIALIDQWIAPLSASENFKSITEQLMKLKEILKSDPVDQNKVKDELGVISEQLSLMAPDMGSEGEMPSLVEGLAAAMRFAAGTSKADLSEK